MSGEGGGRALGECRPEVGAAEAGDIESGTLEGRKQGLFGVAEEVEALDGAAVDQTRSGEAVERPDAGREVVQTGEVFEVAAVAAEQDVTEVDEAVDVLFDGTGSGRRPSPITCRLPACITSSIGTPSNAVRCSTSSPSRTTGVSCRSSTPLI